MKVKILRDCSFHVVQLNEFINPLLSIKYTFGDGILFNYVSDEKFISLTNMLEEQSKIILCQCKEIIDKIDVS